MVCWDKTEMYLGSNSSHLLFSGIVKVFSSQKSHVRCSHNASTPQQKILAGLVIFNSSRWSGFSRVILIVNFQNWNIFIKRSRSDKLQYLYVYVRIRTIIAQKHGTRECSEKSAFSLEERKNVKESFLFFIYMACLVSFGYIRQMPSMQGRPYC